MAYNIEPVQDSTTKVLRLHLFPQHSNILCDPIFQLEDCSYVHTWCVTCVLTQTSTLAWVTKNYYLYFLKYLAINRSDYLKSC